LKSTGQKVGAAAALCHVLKSTEPGSSGQFVLNTANVGDVEVVVCRRREAVCVTRQFTIPRDKEDCQRIFKSDGIITEVSGVMGRRSGVRGQRSEVRG
jgi:hypothetical protein